MEEDLSSLVERYNDALNAVNGELDYQDNQAAQGRWGGDLGKAKTPQDFLVVLRTYLRRTEDAYTDGGGNNTEVLHGLRKLAAIAIRGMVECGAVIRPGFPGK